MREQDFRQWLAEGGAQSTKGQDTRISSLRKLERKLSDLGFGFVDLEEAHAADGFASIIEKLDELRANAREGGDHSRILLPESRAADRRLSYWQSWLKRYGTFLSGEQHGDSNADLIRRHVLETYIEPAREREEDGVEVHVREINDSLGLNANWRNICQALTKRKFLDMADVPAPRRIGAPESPATRFHFDLTGGDRPDPVLSRFRTSPLFADAERDWTAEQRSAFVRVANAVHDAGLDWWFVDITDSPVRFGRKSLAGRAAEAVMGYLRVARPQISFNRKENGFPIVEAQLSSLEGEQGEALLQAISRNLDAIRAWLPPASPRDGFWPDELLTGDFAEQLAPIEGRTPMKHPTNLILYGPPGTGKTYATAREAVRLCGEAVPSDREELMDKYRQLHQKGRIGFVTFHQNFSYEDFVEGLRPVTSGADDGTAAGFTLEPQDGIFKQMAEIAASNRGRAIDPPPVLDRASKVFKMSLGRSWAAEDDAIYQDALRQGYVTLGWGGDIDWSDPRYDRWDEIKQRWRQDFPTASGNDPNMSQMYTFRVNMEVGSLVVVSDGNRKFRAIGQITGPYEHRPSHNGGYNHYRSVRWLWHGESLPRERIYDRELSQVSVYQMNNRSLNWDGIEQTVASGGGAVATSGEPEDHVLVIDEINRANISKVFGELITLLEPDKRLTMRDALTVRLPYSKAEFGVPANLHVIGTMNTADRSIALLDTALRRRFVFREMAPDVTVPEFMEAERRTGLPLGRILTTINERIEYLVDREHRIGHAFFIHCATRDDVDAVMRDKVIPLLQEYFFEDWSRIAAVVGAGFIRRRVLRAPPGLGDLPNRATWSVLPRFAPTAYNDLIGGVAVSEPNDEEGEAVA